MSEMQKRKLSGGIPAAAVGAPQPAARPSQMSQRRTVARGEVVHLVGFGEVWMEVLGGREMEEIEAATWKAMEALGLPPLQIHIGTYNLHRFRRLLAAAVRTVDDHEERFGTLDEWHAEPESTVTAGIALWQDVKARRDPTTNRQLTQEQADEIVAEFKKKDFVELRSFGIDTLVTWLLSGAVQLSPSPTAVSKSGDSSPE